MLLNIKLIAVIEILSKWSNFGTKKFLKYEKCQNLSNYGNKKKD